ncbi:MAG TPA: Gfo/Idh/MocA family oxidoreductase [Candidatus Ratteibacteria bacterium]|nr:Gfo/Idh/MocA family oxidoreductase [bacterium]HRR95539.1 Gfo/Idh/MocA family oxidoreductase [Candidatus Ratteibacteria bacterium]
MDRIKIGVIGVGVMGYAHCLSVKEIEESELTCVSDAAEGLARKRGEEFGVKYFTDYKELITSGLCDAVIVATPHWFHPEVSIFAFENGLHVLSEKPIAVTVSAADKMIESAEKNNRVFAVMFQKRTKYFVRKAKEIVDSGKIGEIIRTVCIDPWYRTQEYYDKDIWRGTWVGEGGGVLLTQAPHMIDIFTHLAGLPCKIEAKTRTKLHNIEVEDEVSAFLEYQNGAWGYYYTSTCEPIGYYYNWEPVGPFYLEVSGDKGKIVIRGDQIAFYNYEAPLYETSMEEFTKKIPNIWELSTTPLKLEEGQIVPTSNFQTGHKEIIRNFVRSILYNEKLITPGKEGLKTIEFMNACLLSGKKNKVVNIPVDRKEYDDLMEELKKTSKAKNL